MSETFVSVVVPLFTTCRLYCTVAPTPAWPLTGERMDLLTVIPGVGAPATVKVAMPLLVVCPTEAAAVVFVASTTVFVARKNTVILVDWPGKNEPRFVQVNLPALVTFTGTLEETYLKALVGKLSVKERFVKMVLPVSIT